MEFQDNQEVQQLCSICQENEDIERFVDDLKCTHHIHEKCLKLWKPTNCPLCRKYGSGVSLPIDEKNCFKCDRVKKRIIVRRIACGHYYHTDCLSKYQVRLCPGCDGLKTALHDEGIPRRIQLIAERAKRDRNSAYYEMEGNDKRIKTTTNSELVTVEKFGLAVVQELKHTCEKQQEVEREKQQEVE
ncbi:hypothetical protein AVEN_210641-1, partial [Araneus ventricosus]